MERKKRILIWGTGKIAQYYLNHNELEESEIVGFVESRRSKMQFHGKKVFLPEDITSIGYDLIFVLINGCSDDIKEVAKINNIDLSKMVFYDTIKWNTNKQVKMTGEDSCVIAYEKCASNEEEIQAEYPVLWHLIDERRYFSRATIATCRNGYDEVDKSQIVLGENFDSKLYYDDYFRFRTFELVANEIIAENIEGECAEVGVFRGDFARLINAKFANRKMYLFDTFEGFDENEIADDITDNGAPNNGEVLFKDTSVEAVLNVMPHREMCVVRKGYFPETAVGLEEAKFAFVSIDVDLEKSIYESLKFFYPRLSNGGVIFLHDYNNRFYFGVRKAVEQFERENGKINKIPIADQGGTLIISHD